MGVTQGGWVGDVVGRTGTIGGRKRRRRRREEGRRSSISIHTRAEGLSNYANSARWQRGPPTISKTKSRQPAAPGGRRIEVANKKIEAPHQYDNDCREGFSTLCPV